VPNVTDTSATPLRFNLSTLQRFNDPWLLLDSGPSDYAFNMGLDEALMDLAPELKHPVLRFYGWTQPAASFGYFQKISEIERTTHLRPLVRRPTGGGLVPHDADWTYSVVVPPNHAWYQLRAAESYERMHRWIQNAFTALNVATELAACCRKESPGQCFAGYEKSDVLWFGKKIAGAAQRRAKTGLLIQGSIQPPPPGIARAAWQSAMTDAAQSARAAHFRSLEITSSLSLRAAELANEKYSRDEHNRRR
jgi:lipoyl(octanoyl) transferase